jgi:hypothetical protein
MREIAAVESLQRFADSRICVCEPQSWQLSE